MATITALNSFPNFEDYKTQGKIAYATAVKDWLKSLLLFQVQANSQREEVISLKDETRRYRDDALTLRADLQQGTDEARLLRNEIHGYVIPDGAAVSADEIDEGFAMLGNQILKLQQDQVGLKLNIKGA